MSQPTSVLNKTMSVSEAQFFKSITGPPRKDNYKLTLDYSWIVKVSMFCICARKCQLLVKMNIVHSLTYSYAGCLISN